MAKSKRTKEQTTIYKTKHIKLKIKQHEPHQKTWVNSGAPEGFAVPASLVALLNLRFEMMHYSCYRSCGNIDFFIATFPQLHVSHIYL